MTREKANQMLPIIQAFANGETIEYWDSMQITGNGRGMWKTAENIGMGAPVSYYRMNKEFIPYEQALELKELGFNRFDEPCMKHDLHHNEKQHK